MEESIVRSRVDLAVIVTCHSNYLHFLPEALASIDRQVPAPSERVLVLDACTPPPGLSQAWKVVAGNWSDPSGGRNAGVAATTAPWLVFLDADNVAPVGYLSAVARTIMRADPNVAIAYPDIQYADETLVPIRMSHMPQFDYWTLRRQNSIDTSSAWRRVALEVVGGWTRGVESHEDYVLALAITAAGWNAVRIDGPAMLMREHGDSRRARLRKRDGDLLSHIWKARSLGVVSLLAGRTAMLERWKRFLLDADLPPKTGLYVVDNSADPDFTERVYDTCKLIADRRSLTHFDVTVTGRPFQIDGSAPYLIKARHLHVAKLYAATFPRITEDLVLTLEDDVEPPLDAIRKLGEEVGYVSRANIGVVAAAYSSPHSPAHVCAGLGPETWGYSPSWQDLPDAPIDVHCVGGGCAMWGNWALRECVPHVQWDLKLGWDGVVCTALRRAGYRVRLHGGVRCAHHTHGWVSSQEAVAPPSFPLAVPRAAPPRASDAAASG